MGETTKTLWGTSGTSGCAWKTWQADHMNKRVRRKVKGQDSHTASLVSVRVLINLKATTGVGNGTACCASNLAETLARKTRPNLTDLNSSKLTTQRTRLGLHHTCSRWERSGP